MTVQKFDIAVIGGGVLGTTISYWISSLSDLKICVIEKEHGVAAHASRRNTGVIHSPFYLDPQKRRTIARAALVSRDMWKGLASKNGLPWKEYGTIEVALDEHQHKSLEKYLKWGQQNGILEKDLILFDSKEVAEREPNVQCHSGLYCRLDASTDFGALTNKMQNVSESQGSSFLFDHEVCDIKNTASDDLTISIKGRAPVTCKFVINCMGGHSLSVAKKMGFGRGYSTLNFRGEYWIAEPPHADLVNTNIYSVASFPEFPFLDPHWIKRANGQTEIGPNAVPVAGPETYSGYIGDIPKTISTLQEILGSSSRKLFLNHQFLALVSKEWKSSLSKTAMVNRVKKFIPSIRPSFFIKKGTAGIRSPVITKEGRFLSEILELEGQNSLHIVNYNSPGATGAPAYAALLVHRLQESGVLKTQTKNRHDVWDYGKTLEGLLN